MPVVGSVYNASTTLRATSMGWPGGGTSVRPPGGVGGRSNVISAACTDFLFFFIRHSAVGRGLEVVDGALQAGDQLVALDAHEEFALVQDAQSNVLVGEIRDEIDQLSIAFAHGGIVGGKRINRQIAMVEFDGRRTRGYRIGLH